MVKVMLTGANGQVGHEVVDLAVTHNLELYPFTHTQLNITEFRRLKHTIAVIKPNYIINAAAYTAVDRAEKESELAFSVNALGVHYLSKIAQEYDIPLLHLSTDYVFDGQKKIPYRENDETKPLSIYGLSKLNGENLLRETWYKHIILRVSWVFGAYGNNFVKTIFHLAKERSELRIITDQKGAPTYAGDIAQTLLKIVDCLHNGQDNWGTYHYTGIPTLNWYEFAQRIIDEGKQLHKLMLKKLIPISALEYPSIALRPYNSELACDRIARVFDIDQNNWFEGLKKGGEGLIMTYTPKNILVTGGAGFIASHFVRYYQEHYPEIYIVNLDKLTYAGSLNNLKNLPFPAQHHFLQGDILDNHLVLKILKDFKVDTLVHFAAETHVDRSINSPEKFVQTNIAGTFTLLEACRKYWLEQLGLSEKLCRFHHISTDEVYGSLQKDEAAFNELMPYRPNSPYSASKASSDYLVRAYYATYGLPISLTHCSNNYGPFQHNEKFIPTIIDCCLRKKPIPVYGDGSNIRDWLYVEDHCNGIDRVIRDGKLGESYNIGGNTELTNLEVIGIICECLSRIRPINYKYTDLITFIKDRPGHDWRYAINAEKISKELGWQPKETLNSGIIKTISAYIN